MTPVQNRKLPPGLTSYDLLKTFAILTMIVDHVGYYFFPEENAFRVIGRMSFPVWFFLIGYARSRDLGWPLWAGAAILLAANVVTGEYIFPVNILGTVIIVRLVLDEVMRRALVNAEALFGMGVMMVLLSIPSGLLTEDGTLALLVAMMGYMMRDPARRGGVSRAGFYFFIPFCACAYALVQAFTFQFAAPEVLAILAGTGLVCLGLYLFKPCELPRMTAALPRPATDFFQLCGRRSLEIYVIHLLLFKFLTAALGDPRFGWFDFSLLS